MDYRILRFCKVDVHAQLSFAWPVAQELGLKLRHLSKIKCESKPSCARPKALAVLRRSSRLSLQRVNAVSRTSSRAVRLAKRSTKGSRVVPHKKRTCHSCHHCRQSKSVELCRLCSTCTRGFCHGCLERQYSYGRSAMTSRGMWQCPYCLDRCTCSICRKQR